jgi:hypothetical protein
MPAVKSRDGAMWKIALMPNAPMYEVVRSRSHRYQGKFLHRGDRRAASRTATERRRDAYFPGEMNKQSAFAT